MTKAKSAKTTGSAKTKTKTKTPAGTKAAAPAKNPVKSAAKKPAKSPVNWSGAIRQALQEKQAPKTWPGGGNEAWKGAPTRKN